MTATTSRQGAERDSPPATWIVIERCRSVEHPGWLELREALWPECPRDEHRREMASFIAQPERFTQLVAYAAAHVPAGFAEAAVRHDYVNGTSGSPVAFLEAIHVVPAQRRRGIASRLVQEVARWAAARGCSELASDAALDNRVSHRMHKALGFEETERVVYFRKALP